MYYLLLHIFREIIHIFEQKIRQNLLVYYSQDCLWPYLPKIQSLLLSVFERGYFCQQNYAAIQI